MDKGTIQIYYGEGRGKTSAALGNAIRSIVDGQNAYFVQFLKGELNNELLSRLEPELKVFRFERCSEAFYELSDEEKEEQKINIQNGLNFSKKALATGECNLLVMDEVLGLVDEGIATADQLVEVLKAKSLFTNVISTGRNRVPELIELADEVVNLGAEKLK